MMTQMSILVCTILLTFYTPTDCIFKEILSSALLGDVMPALSSFRCLTAGKNFTRFFLYSRTNPDEHTVLVPNDWNMLKKSGYDSALPTKVIIHGFIDNMQVSDWMVKMKNALLQEGNYNVIVTDWSCGNSLPYNSAVNNAKIVAEKLGDLVIFLKEARGADVSKFHLIGHSLGSQISGMVGYRVPGIGRISALDPAGPKFYKLPEKDRLDPSDAQFVDVIHTDGGSGLLEGFGLQEKVGHVDFYPNGGQTQPGCHSSPFSVLQRISLNRVARYYVTCDHYRAVDFYIESIGKQHSKPPSEDGKVQKCKYVGVRCRDWKTFLKGQCADCSSEDKKCAIMGYHSDKYPHRNAQGEAVHLYLMTSEHEPYCVFQYQVTIQTTGKDGLWRSDDFVDIDGDAQSRSVYLEVTVQSGQPFRLNLIENSGYKLESGGTYVYLATSKFPLNEVKGATLWWGTEKKPTFSADASPFSFGLRMQSVEIVPIAMDSPVKARAISDDLKNNKVTLCSSVGSTVAKNRFLELSVC